MGKLLQIIGIGWAGVGVYHVYRVGNQPVVEDTELGMAVIIAMIVCVLPGLIVAGIGSIADGRKS